MSIRSFGLFYLVTVIDYKLNFVHGKCNFIFFSIKCLKQEIIRRTLELNRNFSRCFRSFLLLIFNFKGRIMKCFNLKDTIVKVVFIFDAMF